MVTVWPVSFWKPPLSSVTIAFMAPALSTRTSRRRPPRRRTRRTPAARRRTRARSCRVHREVHRLLGDEFEQRRRALARLGDRALDGGHDVVGRGHALAPAAEGLGHVGVVAADVG